MRLALSTSTGESNQAQTATQYLQATGNSLSWMSYRSNSSSLSQHGDQDKRKKGIFSKVFGSSGSGSSRPYDDVPSAYSSQRV